MKLVEAGPQRTCVGCRRRAEKIELIRVVMRGDGLVVDAKFQHPGRGAYLHPADECVKRAEQRKSIGRALRASDIVDLEPVRQFLKNESNTPPK